MEDQPKSGHIVHRILLSHASLMALLLGLDMILLAFLHRGWMPIRLTQALEPLFERVLLVNSLLLGALLVNLVFFKSVQELIGQFRSRAMQVVATGAFVIVCGVLSLSTFQTHYDQRDVPLIFDLKTTVRSGVERNSIERSTVKGGPISRSLKEVKLRFFIPFQHDNRYIAVLPSHPIAEVSATDNWGTFYLSCSPSRLQELFSTLRVVELTGDGKPTSKEWIFEIELQP